MVGTRKAPAPPAGFRTVLKNRQYLVFLASANSSAVGYSVYAISIVWLAYSVSGSLLVVGATLFIEYVAYTATFLLAPLVDRARNMRTIFLVCYPIQAAAAAGIGIGFHEGVLSVGLLLALVALISILWDLPWAVANAAPGVLLRPEEQFAAQGVAEAVGGANSIAGFAVGGALILVVGPQGGMYLYAGLLAVGAFLAIPLHIPGHGLEGESFGESFRDGWREIFAGPDRPLLQLVTMDSIVGFFTSAPAILITLLASVTYAASASTGYAVLFTAEVVGGVAAGLVLGRLNPRGRIGGVLIGSLFAAAALFVLAVNLPPVVALGGIAWLAIGFATTAYLNAKYAFLRAAVPKGRLGRVVSNMYLFPGIAASIGALVIGDAAESGNPWMVGILIAAGFLAAGLVGLWMPRVRALRY